MRWAFWATCILTLIADQVSKAWVRAAFHEGQTMPYPWPGVFEFTLTYNRGVAFGMFQGMGVLTAPIAIAICIGAVLYSRRATHEPPYVHAALGLLTSGAFGNLIDRVWLGKVTDMLWFRLINFPVFNIADSCITVAAISLVIRWGFEAIHHQAPETEKPAAEEPAPDPASN